MKSKWLRRVFVLIITISCLAPVISAHASSAERTYLGEGITTPYICSLFIEPIDNDYYILPVFVSQNTKVQIYEATDEFYYVTSNELSHPGYIKQKNISFTSRAQIQSHGLEILDTMCVRESTSLYHAPDSESGSITSVASGELVTVRMTDGDWMLCTYNNQYTGWIHSQYLEAIKDSGGLDNLGTMYIINCNEWVSLRSDNDDNAPRLAKVARGESVTAHMFVGDWVLCTYNQYTGWIPSRYLGWNAK